MQTISKMAVAVALLLGAGMVVLGVTFISMGYDTKGDIRAALKKEKVITGSDSAIPGVLVEDVVTAKAQQDTIEAHTFGRFGPYSGMERDDPNRDVYLKGLTLRNALNLAVVGFGVADLAIGGGAVTVLLGLIIAGLAIPMHLLMILPIPFGAPSARSSSGVIGFSSSPPLGVGHAFNVILAATRGNRRRGPDAEGDRSTLTGRQAMRRNVVLLRTNLYGYYDR